MSDTAQFPQSLHRWMESFTHRSMHNSARFIKASGLSMPQFFLLMHLHRREQCGISDLSEQMDVTAAATSQLVDKLVQAGLLVRVEDPNDRRAKQVSLSSAGKALVEKGIMERFRWVEEIAASLTEEEQAQVSAALTILTEAARELRLGPAHTENLKGQGVEEG
jgi:MarR family transcriptional regulator, organic hydroperoxide resistance regulator